MSTIPRVLVAVESSRGSGRELLKGIAQFAQERGPWRIYWEPGGLEKKTWPKLNRLDFDGIILRDGDHLHEVLQLDLPAVVIGHGRGELPCLPSVVTDSEGIGVMAANHLMACGYKSFAYCGYLTSSGAQAAWSQLRCQSFSDRIRQAGYSCENFQPPRSYLRSAWRRERNFMARWLRSLPKPLGLMAANDERARHVAEACLQGGISVPSELGIVGVDNDELVCELCVPSLSSLEVNFYQAGHDAASALDCLMQGRRPDPTRIVVYPTQIVVRNSTETKSFSPIIFCENSTAKQNGDKRKTMDAVI